MPSEVKLGHHRGRMPAEFRRLFGTHVAFSSAVDEIKYPGFIARTPITSADPYLNALLVQYCEDALAGRRSKSSAWRVKVENAIVPLLPHGQARIGEISKQLGVSSRTLARRLASEGSTFVKVLDDLRFDLAKRYLQERELPLSEIAWLLGYRESSALSHAFKRWTGTAPRRNKVMRYPLQSRSAKRIGEDHVRALLRAKLRAPLHVGSGVIRDRAEPEPSPAHVCGHVCFATKDVD